MTVTEEETLTIEWASRLFDERGTLWKSRNVVGNRPYTQVRMRMIFDTKGEAERFEKVMGVGALKRSVTTKEWHWNVSARRSVCIALEKMVPYLSERKEQAREMLRDVRESPDMPLFRCDHMRLVVRTDDGWHHVHERTGRILGPCESGVYREEARLSQNWGEVGRLVREEG